VPPADPPDRYAVVGNPVAHSLSPRIHAEFARQTGQALSYTAIEIAIGAFRKGIDDLRQQGFRGLNVTVPFKREAFELCDQLTARATTAGAVNTLSLRENGDIHGDNTDGIGLVRDLAHNLQIKITGQNLLILGAGGAARGVLEPLLALSPASLTIANRSIDKAIDLARDFRTAGKIEVVPYTQLKAAGFHLIINATAAGISNQIPPISPALLEQTEVCYDMMYNLEKATAFVAWSQQHGVRRCYDGLGMLIEQAAEAFLLWRGVRPETRAIEAMLRQQ